MNSIQPVHGTTRPKTCSTHANPTHLKLGPCQLGPRCKTRPMPKPGSRGGGGHWGPCPPSSPASNLSCLPCKTIFLTLFKTSKIKLSCATVRSLPLGQSVIYSAWRDMISQWYLDQFPRYRITKPGPTTPQGFLIVGTIDVQMTINCCKNSVLLIDNLSVKYSMSKTSFCEISDLYTLLAR